MDEQNFIGITQLIQRWSDGEQQAHDELDSIVYAELSRTAQQIIRSEGVVNMLQTSVLVHEAFLHLLSLRKVRWHDRKHFFTIAADVMRRILIDQERSVNTTEKGRNKTLVTLDEANIQDTSNVEKIDILAFDVALQRLVKRDSQQASVVELRFFAGLSIEQTAETLGISSSTVKRHWIIARKGLYRVLIPQEA